jgi:hypothetical protein
MAHRIKALLLIFTLVARVETKKQHSSVDRDIVHNMQMFMLEFRFFTCSPYNKVKFLATKLLNKNGGKKLKVGLLLSTYI